MIEHDLEGPAQDRLDRYRHQSQVRPVWMPGGARQLRTHVMNTRSPVVSRIRRKSLLTLLVLVLVAVSPLSPGTAAKAPPMATTVLEVNALAAPEMDAAVVVVLPADAEVELTGNSAPGFLGVVYDGQEVFVPAQYLSLGMRPGIDTAMAVEDTPLLEAPLRDADVQLTVPEGQTVILTGATVDGYDAASYDGSGGWIDRRGLAR